MTSEVPNKKQRREPPKESFKPAQFINHNFTEDDKRGFKAWTAKHGEDFWDLLDSVLEGGYALSVKPDSFNDCVAAYLSTNEAKNPNFGFILSGRSRSGAMAVYAVLYRHLVLFEGDWPGEASRRSNLDDE